jgi:hypothetical protein
MAQAKPGVATSLSGTPDPRDSTRTVDDLFQILVHTRGKSPPLARRGILKQLQDGALPVIAHIKGGVRSIGVVREPTPEEQVQEKRTGIIAEARYSTTPPEGVTLPVDSQSWEHILLLRIRGERLVIEPGCALDYPWNAYSFTVANWSLVEELWPNPNRVRPDLAVPAPKPEDLPASAREKPSTPKPVERMPVKRWICYAVEQQHDQLVGLGPQRAAKLLCPFMEEGIHTPEKVVLPEKAVGWKRIKNILTEDKLLPIRKAPGKRPRSAR